MVESEKNLCIELPGSQVLEQNDRRYEKLREESRSWAPLRRIWALVSEGEGEQICHVN